MGHPLLLLLLLACSLLMPRTYARLDPAAYQIDPATFSQKDLLPPNFWEMSLRGQLRAWQKLAAYPKSYFPEAINFGRYMAAHLQKYLAQSPWREEISAAMVYLPDVDGLGSVPPAILARQGHQYLVQQGLAEYPGLPGYVSAQTLRHPLLAFRPLASSMLILQLRPKTARPTCVLAQYLAYLEERFLQIDPLIFDPVGNFLHQSTAYFRNDLTGARPYLGFGLEVLADLLDAPDLATLKNNIPLHHELLHWQNYVQTAQHRYGPFAGIMRAREASALQVLGDSSQDFGPLIPLDEIFAYWHSVQDAFRELATLITIRPIDWDKIQTLIFSTHKTLEALAHHLTAGIRLSNYAYHHFARYHGKAYPVDEYKLTVIPVAHTFTADGQKRRASFALYLPQGLRGQEEVYLKFQQTYLVPLQKKFIALQRAWAGEVERLQNLYQREFHSMMEEPENDLNPAYSGHPLSAPSFYQECAHLLQKAAAKNSLPPTPFFDPKSAYPHPPSSRELPSAPLLPNAN